MRSLKVSFVISFLLILSGLLQAGYEIKVIQNPEELPEKFCTIAQKGDFFISDGRTLVLLGGTARALETILNFPASNAMGSIIAFVPAGKKLTGDVNVGSPVFRIKNKTLRLVYSSLNEIKSLNRENSLVLEALASYDDRTGKAAKIKTIYRFFPEKSQIEVTSSVTNAGKDAFNDLSYSLYSGANSRYWFNPYHEKRYPDLNFRVYQKKGHSVGWISFNPVEKEGKPLPGKLVPGETFELRYLLLVDTTSAGLLERIYQILDKKALKASVHFKDFDGETMEVIVRDIRSGTIFFRSFMERTFSLEFPLPEGFYTIRANLFPAVVDEMAGVRPDQENSWVIQNPPQGILKVKIKNSKGEFVPGKVTFIGLDPTKTPYFKPENPIETGRAWEDFKNSCFPPEEGLEVKLPVGTYLVYGARGPEYSFDHKIIEILKDDSREILFTIDKIVETPNLVSLDAHLHTHNSDGSVTISERIKSLVAEGLDAAIAADHNFITDYTSTLKKLGLNKYLAVRPGSEVSVGDMIHYNAYPLTIREGEHNNGAISPIAERAAELFHASLQKEPGALLQLNHPRARTLGYFNNYQLDLESAATAQKDFDLGFNVIEIMNGPYPYNSDPDTFNASAIEDWFHLLNRGYYFPAVGCSDSHEIDKNEPGYSRTYISYRGEKADLLDWPSLVQVIKEGRSFVSNGPLVQFHVNDKFSSGDTLTAKSRKIDIWLKIWSAPWIFVDEVRLILNGERKVIFPVKARERDIKKFEETVSLVLKKDTYLIVEVLGKKTLFPVHQEALRSGLVKDAVLPYAMTNPVFIDVDGNGRFDPPLPEKVRLTEAANDKPKIISRY